MTSIDAPLTHTLHKTPYGQVARFSDGPPEQAIHYLTVEKHEEFSSVAWSTRSTLPDAISCFFSFLPCAEIDAAEAVITRLDGSTTRMAVNSALPIMEEQHETIHLMRLEFPNCAFMWRAERNSETLPEIRFESENPSPKTIEQLVKETATLIIAENAKDLVSKVTAVIW